MTTGSWNVYIDEQNQSSKTWSGPDGRQNENPYSMAWRSLKGGKSQNEFGQWVYVYPPWAGAKTLPNAANEELKAYAALQDAIRGHDFDTGVFAATSHQTAALVADNAKKVFGAYRALKKGDFGSAARALGNVKNASKKGAKVPLTTQDLANSWLELQYGWLPLLSDIHSALEAYDYERDLTKVVYRSRSTTRQEVIGDQLGNLAQTEYTVKLKAYVRETGRPAFSIVNPVTIAWEVLPWSFVVDWFIPVGDYLAAASFFSSIDFRVMMTTFRRVRFYVKPLKPPYPYTGGWRDCNTVGLSRILVAQPSVPKPTFKSLEKALSTSHLQNAAALVRGLIKNR